MSEFDKWLDELAQWLRAGRSMSHADADKYIDMTGLRVWRAMFENGVTPADAYTRDLDAVKH